MYVQVYCVLEIRYVLKSSRVVTQLSHVVGLRLRLHVCIFTVKAY